MPSASPDLTPLDDQIAQWRTFLHRRQAIHTTDAVELEDHLREQVAALLDAGLAPDEAFLVAVKRMGDLDGIAREFAREHSERLWKQLVLPDARPADRRAAWRDGATALGLAIAAALSVQLPKLFGIGFETHERFFAHNLAFFVLPFLTGYFVWKRRLDAATTRWLVVTFLAAVVTINGLPFGPTERATEVLASLHLPIALWLAVGVAYAGGRWGEVAGRMDFIRFSGELFVYFVLIALGGGLFTGMLLMLFQAIGIDAEPFVQHWLVPSGAAGAAVTAAWLVEAKQSVIENIAPVLTRLFTPLFSALLVVFLGALLGSGRAMSIDRDLLIGFNAMLVVVLALVLYTLSARDREAPAGPFDAMQLILVASALAADGVALSAIGQRITEYGFSPNRTAVLGMNLLLLGNLSWSAVLSWRFLRGRGTFAALERWQTHYLPLYAAWAALVVLLFPPLFGYV